MSPRRSRAVVRAWKRLTKRKAELVFITIAALCLSRIMRSYGQSKETLRCCRTGPSAEGCIRCPPRSAVFCKNCSTPAGSRSAENQMAEDIIFPYKYLVNVPNACKGSALRYLVAVSSEPENLVDRQLLRMSVVNVYLPNSTVRRIFFMGRPNDSYAMERLNEEHGTHRDLVIGDFSSTPENATLVSIMVLKWVMTFCPNAEFTVKLSTSGRVNMRSLRLSYRLFKELQPDYELFGTVVPLDGQACIQTLGDRTLSYCLGPGYLAGCVYVMTHDAVRPMFYAVADNPIFPREELYVTYFLAQSIGARKADVTTFNGCYLNSMSQSKPGLGSWLRRKLGIE